MANYTQLIKTINDNIKANGNQEITGPVLNAVLQAIVSGMSEGALFAGIADTTTNPPAYDGNVFYIAIEPGNYTNFGVDVPRGSVGVLHNMEGNKWNVFPINTYYTIDVDMLMQDSPSSDDIDEAIGGLSNLKRAIIAGVPFFGRSASGNNTVAIAQVEQLSANEVRVVMLNTGTIDGSNEPVPIIKKIAVSAGQLSLSTEAPTSFIGPLSSLSTNEKGSVVEAINEVNTGLKAAVKPYVVNLTSLLAAQDSESISTAIGGIDNLNGTVQKNQVIFGTLANGTVAVGIRVLGNQTTLTYFVNSVVGLTVNEIIITNTSGTLTKTANTHAVLTENMVVNNLESDEATLPLSAAQGKALSEDVKTTYQKITDNTLSTTAKTVVGAINENTGNVTRIDRAVGNPVIEEVDLRSPDEPSACWGTSNKKISSPNCRIKYVSLSKGDYISIYTSVGSGIQPICLVDNTYAKVINNIGLRGIGNFKSFSYLATEDCFAALSYTVSISNTAYIVKSSQNTAIADAASSTAALHKIYEEYGAVYNAETGYWEYGDLKDMTEEDCFLAAFYALEQVQGDSNSSYILDRFRNTQARTYFTKIYPKGSYNTTSLILNSCFAQNLNLEYLKLSTESTSRNLYINHISSAFRNCPKLRKIEDILSIYTANDMTNTFTGCIALRDLKIRFMGGVNTDVSFQDSPFISYESLNFLVTNAANTSAITVTVHPTTYSYLTGTAQPTEEVGGTTEEWQALVTTAQGKQISFAQPAETLEVKPLE